MHHIYFAAICPEFLMYSAGVRNKDGRHVIRVRGEKSPQRCEEKGFSPRLSLFCLCVSNVPFSRMAKLLVYGFPAKARERSGGLTSNPLKPFDNPPCLFTRFCPHLCPVLRHMFRSTASLVSGCGGKGRPLVTHSPPHALTCQINTGGELMRV